MTERERQLIRTCLCNGFEFHQELQSNKYVKINNTKFKFDRICSLFEEIEQALDKQAPKKMKIEKGICYDGEEVEYEVCADCGVQVRIAGTMTAKYCWNCGQRIKSIKERENDADHK